MFNKKKERKNWKTGLVVLNMWISSLSRQQKKKEISGKKGQIFLPSVPLSWAHTHVFILSAGWRAELARQQGWISCNWNWCKQLWIVLSLLLVKSLLQHRRAFSPTTDDEKTAECQNVVAPCWFPFYISQDRLPFVGLEYLQAVLTWTSRN